MLAEPFTLEGRFIRLLPRTCSCMRALSIQLTWRLMPSLIRRPQVEMVARQV
jgi:hypothetical protein